MVLLFPTSMQVTVLLEIMPMVFLLNVLPKILTMLFWLLDMELKMELTFGLWKILGEPLGATMAWLRSDVDPMSVVLANTAMLLSVWRPLENSLILQSLHHQSPFHHNRNVTSPRLTQDSLAATLLDGVVSWKIASVWPDWAIYWTLGNFSKPVPKIYLAQIVHIFRRFL